MKKLLALLLAMMMVFALCACGGGDKTDDAAAPAAPAADGAPADAPQGAVEPPEGASGEPTGEPVAELFPADGYSKDLDGYKAYAIEALKTDEHAPADIVDSTVESINAATDGDDASFSMMINQGRIMSYDEFVK